MRMKRSYWVGVALMSAALLVVACGDGTEVTAINLKTGEQQTFTSPEDVPGGWAVCKDGVCEKVPGAIPCAYLGPKLCEKNDKCEITEICIADGGAPAPAPGSESSSGDATSPPEPYPWPFCHKTCADKTAPRVCDQIRDSRTCQARKDCDWVELPYGAPCFDSSCPPPAGQCVTRKPATCEQLGQLRCEARPECQWTPKPCFCGLPTPLPDPDGPSDGPDAADPNKSDANDPNKPDGQDDDGASDPGSFPPPPPACECPAFCETRKQCPEIFIAPPDCAPGQRFEPKYDPNGCVVGGQCVAKCPATPIFAECPPDSRFVPEYDDQGCLVGGKCTQDCPPVAMAYCAPGYRWVPDHDSRGCPTGGKCVLECKPAPKPAIGCADGAALVPIRDAAGCVTRWDCPPPRNQCDALVKEYAAVLKEAKQCRLLPSDSSAMEPCGTLVPDSLICSCDTYVNSQNQAAIAKLKSIRAAAASCFKDVACAAIACRQPTASCSPSSGSSQGSCQ